MPVHTHCFLRSILTRKVGQTDLVSQYIQFTDLVSGVRCGFSSGSVHARLQISVCSSYDLCQHGFQKHTHTQSQHFDEFI